VAQYNYERLSAQDNSFLLFETPKVQMHVSSTSVYKAGPLMNEEGGIDFARIRRSFEACLHRIPRYRQKLYMIPFEDRGLGRRRSLQPRLPHAPHLASVPRQ